MSPVASGSLDGAQSAALQELQEQLGYRFRDQGLLVTALTHRSYPNEGDKGVQTNERLEFLGDAVLGFLVAEILYVSRPELTEGELTRSRANLVNRRTLASIARRFGLEESILLGRGTRASGAHRQDSVLSDAWEAIIGAAYLDGGLDASRTLVNKSLESIRTADEKDPKSRLQEETQARRKLTPAYILLEAPPESPEFVVEVRVAGVGVATGAGPTKSTAEQAAAATALREMHPQHS